MSHSHSRPISKLSDSTSRLLNTYAVSAASTCELAAPCGMHGGPCHHSPVRWAPVVSAALGALALALPAEAEIIYTPADVQIHKGTFYFHFTPTGPYDVVFQQKCSTQRAFRHCGLYAFPISFNGIQAVIQSSYSWAKALKGGSAIGPGVRFGGAVANFMASTVDSERFKGYWFASGARFLGVRFQINGKTHYGWMRLVNSSQRGATLTGYAYETIPNKPIKAGYRKDEPDDLSGEPQREMPEDSAPTSSVDPLPLHSLQPGSLGMLALGAQAIPVMEGKE